PLLGYLVYKKNINAWLASFLAILICILSVIAGVSFPISINSTLWMVILSFYCLLAAGIPVWIILQPRDFANSFMLYAGIAGLFVAGIAAGLKGETLQLPAMNLAEGNAKLGPIWPFLFITVACGAISGFHSLVSGGTTSKQISRESDAKKIAFGGMLLEGLLAVGVLVAIGCGIMFKDYAGIVFPVDPSVKSNPILAFSLATGGLLYKGLGIPAAFGTVFGILMVEGFVVTTLDTAVRLNRYLFEELWTMLFKKVPGFLKTYIFNALLCVVLMFVLSYYNAFLIIWPVFGSANQLLASLALLAVSVWLTCRGKSALFTVIPAVFMLVTTIYSLSSLMLNNYPPNRNYVLTVFA
ncbi:MAG: carbon starvation CstA family protein, partial [Candidatus Firestonebacteria bacterium]